MRWVRILAVAAAWATAWGCNVEDNSTGEVTTPWDLGITGADAQGDRAMPKDLPPLDGEAEDIRDNPIPVDGGLADLAPSDLAHSDLPPSDLPPSDLAPSDRAPSDLPPRDLAPSDLAPSDRAPSDLPPSDLAPSDLPRRDISPQDQGLEDRAEMGEHTILPLPPTAGPMVRIRAMSFQNLGEPLLSSPLVSLLNALLPPYMDDFSYLPLMEFFNLTDPSGPTAADLTLKLYLGLYDALAEGIYIDGDSLDQSTGEAKITLPGASVNGGDLRAGPAFIPWDIPPLGMMFPLSNAHLEGILEPNATGLDASLRGLLYARDLKEVMLSQMWHDVLPGRIDGSLLGLLITGVSGAMAPLQPDHDVDGDGLEWFEANMETGALEACHDCTCRDREGQPLADCTCTTGEVILQGDDCAMDPGIQDAYTFSMNVEGVEAHPLGVWVEGL